MRNSPIWRNALLISASVVVVAVLSQSASAQTDFFKRGGELLRKIPGTSGSSSSVTQGLTDGEIGAGLR